MAFEKAALHQQLAVYHRTQKRPRLRAEARAAAKRLGRDLATALGHGAARAIIPRGGHARIHRGGSRPSAARLAVDRPLFTALLRTLFAWQRRRGRALGIRDGQTGAVSFLQRFGGGLNLHPHVHSLLPDGLFVPADDGLLTFVPLPPPTDEDVAALALKVARRLTAVVERHCDDTCESDGLLAEAAAALQQALAVAVRAPVPRAQLRLPGQDDSQRATKPLCARVAGFSLHAARLAARGSRRGAARTRGDLGDTK